MPRRRPYDSTTFKTQEVIGIYIPEDMAKAFRDHCRELGLTGSYNTLAYAIILMAAAEARRRQNLPVPHDWLRSHMHNMPGAPWTTDPKAFFADHLNPHLSGLNKQPPPWKKP